MYRIVQEQAIEPNKVNSVLNNLKKRYGMPDKQQIKTGSVRPRNRKAYTTTVKNKAIWNISETQEFIAEIERKRAVYELLDNNPENIKSSENTEASEGGELRPEGWNPDYWAESVLSGKNPLQFTSFIRHPKRLLHKQDFVQEAKRQVENSIH